MWAPWIKYKIGWKTTSFRVSENQVFVEWRQINQADLKSAWAALISHNVELIALLELALILQVLEQRLNVSLKLKVRWARHSVQEWVNKWVKKLHSRLKIFSKSINSLIKISIRQLPLKLLKVEQRVVNAKGHTQTSEIETETWIKHKKILKNNSSSQTRLNAKYTCRTQAMHSLHLDSKWPMLIRASWRHS